ncbi:MAG: 30S ribosomal protein S2 [Elusimicrobiota bacterium]|nr:30S ribosomal protein S2 [Elusimicrobiota bacterium]
MSSVTIKELLDSGVHFGHQTRRWNPKMESYIFESRSKIHIIDVRKTLRLLNNALNFIREVVENGKDVLLVGTKKQAREILKETAERLQMHYVVDRWLGGALTNFQTIRLSINRLEELEAIREESSIEGRSKKEVASLRREEHKLHRNLDGIRAMDKLPGVMVIIDIGREMNAVREGRKLNIPIVALVDTNRDPSLVNFPIPGNDDGIRATKLIVAKIEEAIAEGLELRKKKIEEKKSKKSAEKKSGETKKKKKKQEEKVDEKAEKKKEKPVKKPESAIDKSADSSSPEVKPSEKIKPADDLPVEKEEPAKEKSGKKTKSSEEQSAS